MIKLKARLVARGFSQANGTVFEDNFGSTVKFDTLRLLFAIFALEDFEYRSVDVNDAFTESCLTATIYMVPPPGVEVPAGCLFRMLRSLYGFKHATRDGHQTCMDELIKLDIGFQQCHSDPCLLLHYHRRDFLYIYVDDTTIASENSEQIHLFKSEFPKLLEVKDLGEMKTFLGIKIIGNRCKSSLHMDPTHCLKSVYMWELRSTRKRALLFPDTMVYALQSPTRNASIKDSINTS